MISVVIIFLCATVAGAIIGYEYFKKKAFIAKIVDNQEIPDNFVSEDVKNLINMIKDRSKNHIDRDTILLPDGQKISYYVSMMETFKKYSSLKFSPTNTEWEILRLIVKKVYNLS